MAETVVDSSILIDYLRGREPAREYLEALQSADELATHIIVAAEVLTGARDQREQEVIQLALREFRMHVASEADCSAALNSLSQFRLSHGVGWHDCLIAASCVRKRLPLATLNEKHFSVFDDLDVVRPY